MKVLILEDEDYRIEGFREKLANHELFITKDPKEANKWLEEEQFGFIFLDHDLADGHYKQDTICNETTGLCTAEFLGDHPWLSKDAEIVVHSLNPNGRRRMMQAMQERNAREVPFTILIQGLQG